MPVINARFMFSPSECQNEKESVCCFSEFRLAKSVAGSVCHSREKKTRPRHALTVKIENNAPKNCFYPRGFAGAVLSCCHAGRGDFAGGKLLRIEIPQRGVHHRERVRSFHRSPAGIR